MCLRINQQNHFQVRIGQAKGGNRYTGANGKVGAGRSAQYITNGGMIHVRCSGSRLYPERGLSGHHTSSPEVEWLLIIMLVGNGQTSFMADFRRKMNVKIYVVL